MLTCSINVLHHTESAWLVLILKQNIAPCDAASWYCILFWIAEVTPHYNGGQDRQGGSLVSYRQ